MLNYMVFCATTEMARLAEKYLGILGYNGCYDCSVDSFLFDNEIIEDIPLVLVIDKESTTFDVAYCQHSFVECVIHNGSKYKVLNFEQCINVKQVIVWRKDLKVRLGKKMAQAAHASMAPIFNMMTFDKKTNEWTIKDELFSPFMMYKLGAFKKIVLSVDNEEELLQLYNRVKQHSHYFHKELLPVTLITDSGLTEFNGIPTNTCIGIGPYESHVIDLYTKDLQLL